MAIPPLTITSLDLRPPTPVFRHPRLAWLDFPATGAVVLVFVAVVSVATVFVVLVVMVGVARVINVAVVSIPRRD